MAADDVDKLRERGKASFAASKFDDALQQYTAALSAAPQASCGTEEIAKLHNNVSLCLMKLQRYVEAGLQALESLRIHGTPKSLFRLASALYACGAGDDANNIIQHGLDTIKKLCRVTDKVDRDDFASLRSSHRDDARVVPSSVDRASLDRLRAAVAQYLSHASSAQAERKQVPTNGRVATAADAEAPESAAEALRHRGTELYKQGDYVAAVQAYSEALSKEPDAATRLAVLGNRAAAETMLKRWQAARDDCEAVIALDANSVRAYPRLCKACLALGDVPGAVRWAREACGREPGSGALKDNLRRAMQLEQELTAAQAAVRARDGARAMQCARRAEALYPDLSVPPVQVALAEALLLDGRNDRALQISRAVLADAKSSEALAVHARALLASGNTARALAVYQQMYREDPDNTAVASDLKRVRAMESNKERGNEAFKEGRYQAAYDAYSKSLDACEHLKNTFRAQVATNRANACLKLGRYRDAVADATMALEADKEFAKAFLRRAQGLERLENWEGAVQDYQQALQLDGELAGVQDMLRRAKVELKKSKRVDYYKLLGVDKSAGEADIKKAYKRAALKMHPDKAPAEERDEAEKRFKLLGEANAILTDEAKRQRYDAGWSAEEIENGFQEGMGGMGGGMGGMGGTTLDPEILMQMFGGGIPRRARRR